MNQKIRTAVIGLGWGKNLLAAFNRQSEVVYACHRGSTKSVAELQKPEYSHIESTTDISKVFGDNSVQAVAIATPTDTHYNIAKAALEAGKDVLLEKPGGNSPDELERLTMLADNVGRKLCVDYEFVMHPAMLEMKRRVAPEQIELLHAIWLKYGTFTQHSIPNLACHIISVALGLGLKKFEPRKKFEVDFKSKGDIVLCRLLVDESIDFWIQIQRVAVATKSLIFTIKSSTGNFSWDGDMLAQIEPAQGSPKMIPLPSVKPVDTMVEDFLLAVRDGRPPLIDGRFALKVYDIIEQIMKSPFKF